MKICWIKAGGFLPADFGGSIRSYHMVKALAERHDVTLVTFYREQAADPHPQLRSLFSDLVLAPLRLPAGPEEPAHPTSRCRRRQPPW